MMSKPSDPRHRRTDDAEPSRPDLADGQQRLQEIRHILGPLARRRAPASSADDKAALSAALAEKYDH